MATCTIEYHCGCKRHFDRSDKWLAHRLNESCPEHNKPRSLVTFDPFQDIAELVPEGKRTVPEGTDPQAKRGPGILPGPNGERLDCQSKGSSEDR